MNLKDTISSLPATPGIYQYFDTDGKLLYIGKAKNLKSRVKSYFKFTPTLAPHDKLSQRIFKMISETKSINYIVVQNENDALILENSLIKQLKPKYNILLRDDKTFPYIYIDFSEDFPRPLMTRKIISSKGVKYFGPYSTGCRDMLDSLYELLPLVQKSSCIKSGKACIYFQMNMCLAPCESRVTKEKYKDVLNQAVDLIQNKHSMIKKLKIQMASMSAQNRFEDAIVLRDRIQKISKSQIKSTTDIAKNENFDIVAIKQYEQKVIIVRWFIRDGKVVSASHNIVNTNEPIESFDELFKTTIINNYKEPLPNLPNLILFSHNTSNTTELEEFLDQTLQKRVKILTPKIGAKKDLVDLALTNCDEILKQNKTTTDIDRQIKELFGFENIPKRYEVFDNSHMAGEATVGAMVVYDDNRFIKADSRLYHLEAKDEYSQMKEMLTRRAIKFKQYPPPDIWLIDGGATLLKLAYEIVQSTGANIDIVAISKEKIDKISNRAKGKAKDILYTKENIYKLQDSDKRLQFCQNLRDMAHKKAINFHKNTKLKQDKDISLLSISGIGKAKVQKLINYFGEFDSIKKASIDELNIVINKTDSEKVFQFYQTRE
ncbi:MAG: excinuclease ABC subunit C [Campylobacteraceae bacterium 4484_166]|nr:MAG: excinuclease ABC subunit C [Campylobacteraceae bacterium 4484_166]